MPAPGHEHKLLSPSRVNATGLPNNWFWRRFYCLEASPKGSSLIRFLTLKKKKKLMNRSCSDNIVYNRPGCYNAYPMLKNKGKHKMWPFEFNLIAKDIPNSLTCLLLTRIALRFCVACDVDNVDEVAGAAAEADDEEDGGPDWPICLKQTTDHIENLISSLQETTNYKRLKASES